MPPDHHRQQLRLRHPRHERLDDDRRLGLPHEDVGRGRERLRSARPHQEHHRARHQPDDELQDAEVVEHGEERGDEDDRRQRGEGEDEAVPGPKISAIFVWFGEHAEHERRAGVGELEEAADAARDRGEELIARTRAADLNAQDQHAQIRAASAIPHSTVRQLTRRRSGEHAATMAMKHSAPAAA